MSWHIPVILKVLVSFCAIILLKKNSDLPALPLRFFIMYSFLICVSLSAVLITDHAIIFDRYLVLSWSMGLLSSFAAYCQWRAIRISLSHASLFGQMEYLLSIALGCIILKEYELVTPAIIFAIALTLSAAALIAYESYLSNVKALKSSDLRTLATYILAFSLIWGVTDFLMRYLAFKEEVPIFRFLLGWYGGSFTGAVVIFVRNFGTDLKISRREVFNVFLLALTIWSALACFYWSNMVAPLVVTQPLFSFTSIALPTITGLWLFHEIKYFGPLGRAALCLGVLGGLLIALTN